MCGVFVANHSFPLVYESISMLVIVLCLCLLYVAEDHVKTALQKMPNKSCDLDPIPTPVLFGYLDEIIPIITDKINVSMSSGIVPKRFKHALVKPQLKKANLDLNCLKKLLSYFQSATVVKGTGVCCAKPVFAALRSLTAFWSPSSQSTESAIAPELPCCL